MVSLVGSVPPVQTTIVASEGLEIESPNFNYIPQGIDHTFRFRVYNASNNAFFNKSDVNCSLGLVDSMGNYFFQKPEVEATGYKFAVFVNGANFSELGIYHQGINCYHLDTGDGGVKTQSFEVTGTGDVLDTPKSIFYSMIMVILSFLFVITIFGFNMLPNQDPKDLDGKLMDINWLKYLRYPIGILAWGELTMIFFLGWNIAEGYLTTGLAASIFEILYKLNFYSLMIALPIMFFYILVKAIEDKKFKAMIERGIM